MTREEKMMNAAEAYAEEIGYKDDNDMCCTMNIFCAGWYAADQHNQWISVEDELPKPYMVGANSTDYVLVYDGDNVIIAYYDFNQRNWRNEEYGILLIAPTHWMPMPTPPQKNNQNCITCQRYEPIGIVGGGKTYHYCNRDGMNYPCDPENSAQCCKYIPRKEDKK